LVREYSLHPIHGILGFVYQGHRVKVKVTAVKKLKRGWYYFWLQGNLVVKYIDDDMMVMMTTMMMMMMTVSLQVSVGSPSADTDDQQSCEQFLNFPIATFSSYNLTLSASCALHVQVICIILQWTIHFTEALSVVNDQHRMPTLRTVSRPSSGLRDQLYGGTDLLLVQLPSF